MSGGYFNTAAQSLLQNTIYKTLQSTAPQISRTRIDAAGAADLDNSFSGTELTLVLEAYMAGIKNVFIFAIAGVVATFLVSLMIPPTRIPAATPEEKDDEK